MKKNNKKKKKMILREPLINIFENLLLNKQNERFLIGIIDLPSSVLSQNLFSLVHSLCKSDRIMVNGEEEEKSFFLFFCVKEL